MEKLTRYFEVDCSFSWGDITIADIRADLDIMEHLGVTHVNISVESCYGDDFVRYDALCLREETDEEYAERVQLENDEIRLRELAELKRLKDKYGDVDV